MPQKAQRSEIVTHHCTKPRTISKQKVRSCLTNLPLNFLGGLLRSPASGCTTHRSSTRLQRNEQWSEIAAPCSPCHPPPQHQSRSLAIFHPSGHFSRRHSPNANLCQIFLRSMQLIVTVAQSYAPGRWDNKKLIAPVFCIIFMSPARGADRTAHILGRWQPQDSSCLLDRFESRCKCVYMNGEQENTTAMQTGHWPCDPSSIKKWQEQSLPQ